MTREQYNQANDYVSQIEFGEDVIWKVENAMNRVVISAEIEFIICEGVAISHISIRDEAFVDGLSEYIKAWYTNRKTELETLLSEI